MGMQYSAICNSCGHRFTVSEGGGFQFHLLHCDKCGRTEEISFEDIGEPHLRFLKGLSVQDDAESELEESDPRNRISEEKYNSIVEGLVGTCICGGHYKLDAPPRCPSCKSDDLENVGEEILYD